MFVEIDNQSHYFDLNQISAERLRAEEAAHARVVAE